MFAVAGSKPIVAAPFRQSRPLEFELELCGRGGFPTAPVTFYSAQTYKVSDGTALSVEYISFSSRRLASRRMKEETKAVVRVLSRENLTDERGKRSGRRVVALESKDGGGESTVSVSLIGRRLRIIRAASPRHIREFQAAADGD